MKERAMTRLTSDKMITSSLYPRAALCSARAWTRLMALMVSSALSLSTLSASADMGKAYRDAERLDRTTKSKRSAAALSEIKSALRVALKSLQEAYDQNEIKQTNCIKGHLATVKGLLRIAEEAEVSLKEAMITGQVDLINHEYVKIMMAVERAKRAQGLMLSCSGDLSDPLKASKQTTKPEVFDKTIQDYTPSSDESSVIVYDSIASERPEAISTNE